MVENQTTISVGLVGYGYWGPNLARNFSRQPSCCLVAICDLSSDRTEKARLEYPNALVTQNYDDLVNDDAIQLILVATPVFHHYELTKRALEAGKDVLVEKPLTDNVVQAKELVEIAEKRGRILAVDHTYLFTPAMIKIREIIESRELGNLVYMDSVRVNLGLFQSDVNVIWDLAPHDFSINRFLTGRSPSKVRAIGHCHGIKDKESIAYVHLDYEDGLFAHCHFNWLSPVKIRQMLICGSKKMIVYDDLEQSEKVKVYDKGITIQSSTPNDYSTINVGYRTGDMMVPNLTVREALDLEAEHILACVRGRNRPLVDGRFGLDVVRQISACQNSLEKDGQEIGIEA
jgi:predicted dehydrogenase